MTAKGMSVKRYESYQHVNYTGLTATGMSNFKGMTATGMSFDIPVAVIPLKNNAEQASNEEEFCQRKMGITKIN